MIELKTLLDQLKDAGLSPAEVHVKIEVGDAKEIAAIQEELKSAGVPSEVHISLQVGEGGGRKPGMPIRAMPGEKVPTKTEFPKEKESSGPGTSTEAVSPILPPDSLEVEVAADKVLLRFYKDTDKGKNKQGKPVMLVREPRIRLDKGERFIVSASHKESANDQGDGTVQADGGTYFLVTDARFEAGKDKSDKLAAKFDNGEIKLFVPTGDVKLV